jgi:hypothetical protein
VSDRKKSVLGDPQWEWAREYLLSNPIAIAAELPARRMLAVAQPEPLDGWLAIDAVDATAIDKQLGELSARWRSEGKPIGTKLKTGRTGAQIVAKLDQPSPDDLIALVSDLVATADLPADTAGPAFDCPKLDIVKSCNRDGRQLIVTSTPDVLAAMTNAPMEPVVDNGDIAGVRLTEDAAVLLKKGDIIIGIEGNRIHTKDELLQHMKLSGRKASLGVRRGGVDVAVTVSELQ